MKTRYILYPLLMLMAILLPTSCSFEEDVFDAPAANGNKISFTMDVSLVGASNVESRSFGNTNFNFTSLHIAVFEVTEDGSYLREFLDNDDITLLSGNDGDGCRKFNVTITKASAATGKKYRLHLIANYPGLTMGFGEEGQRMGLLETQANDKDVYWNFVELTSISESSVISLQHVPLVRNYVQIKIDANSNFTGLTNVQYALYYVPTKGRVAAYNTNPEATSKFANFVKVKEDGTIGCQDYDNLLGTQKYAGNEAYDDGTLLSNNIDELDWKDITAVTDDTDRSVSYNSTISYMYERNHSQRVNPTCMLIKGTYNGSTSYYKLDFVDGNGDYYNLLRNFIYTMRVTEVKGPGYETAEKALNHPAGNNISGDTKTATFTNISDGTGQLYVSTTSILFTQEQPVDLYFKYIPDISAPTTTSNDDVTISGTTGNVLASVSDVVDVNMGQYEGWSRITLNPKDIPAIAAFQELTFTAGGLKRTVKLQSQLPFTGMTVLAYDGENNPLNKEDDVINMEIGKKVKVDITLPAGIPESLFPLRLFIRSVGNTIYPDYGTNMPAETQNGNYGFIKEVSFDAYNKSTDKMFSCDFLTNCVDNGTTIYVENQYLATAKDKIKNNWKTQVNIHDNIGVNIEKIWGRNPQTIYNNGTKSVTVTLDGVNKGSITINSSKVVNGSSLLIEDTKGLSKNDVVVFEFTDNYWHGQWSTTPITWRAEATLGALDNGTTLNFKAVGEIAKINSITIPQGLSVVIPREGGYWEDWKEYPYKIYNYDENNGTESVTVTIKGTSVTTTITIDSNDVTADKVWEYSAGFSISDELVFTFNDQYCTGMNYQSWQPTWSSEVTFTATCTVGEMLSGASLNFSHR